MNINEIISQNCKFCNKKCKNPNSLRNHERLCPQNKDRVYTPGMLGKVSPMRGKTASDTESIRRGAEKLKQRYASGEISAASPATTKEFWTDEKRKAKSEWRKQLHIDHPETHPNRRLAGNRNKMTYPEKVAFDYLSNLNVKFEHQKQIGKYFPDFVIGNIIIEIDGAQWHTDSEKDQERDSALNRLGYTVFRIGAKERIEIRIKEILGFA